MNCLNRKMSKGKERLSGINVLCDNPGQCLSSKRPTNPNQPQDESTISNDKNHVKGRTGLDLYLSVKIKWSDASQITIPVDVPPVRARLVSAEPGDHDVPGVQVTPLANQTHRPSRAAADDEERKETMTDTPKRRPRTKGSGSVFRTPKSKYWYIAYTSGGKRHFESSESERKSDAIARLNNRLGDIEKGVIVSPALGKVTVREGLQMVLDDMTMNKKRSVGHTKRRIDKHLMLTMATASTPAVGYFHPDRRLNTIGTDDLKAYVVHRMAQKASSASCNLELAIVRRAFKLAIVSRKLTSMPHIPMLRLSNVRTGFFERAEFEAVREALPAPLRGVATFAFLTGWRRSEILSLEWSNVDRDRQVITLAVGTTKNNDGRTLPYGLLPELVTVIETAWTEHERLLSTDTISPYVFSRNGKQIKAFRGAWAAACELAKCPHKIVHDFRRTAARNLIRAGVPEKMAMAVTGHKTRSVFDRYNIVVEDDVRNALGALATASTKTKPPAKSRRGQVHRFKARKTA